MENAFWAAVTTVVGLLSSAFQLDANNPKQQSYLIVSALVAVVVIVCLGFMIWKWLRMRSASVVIEYGTAFDTREPSRQRGIVHTCRVRVTNNTGKMVTNAALRIVDLVPEHEGQTAFLLRDNINLAHGEFAMINIASHVEGSPDSAHLMNLQLPVYGGFYMSEGYGKVLGEQQFSIVCDRYGVVLTRIRCRLRINNINLMKLTKID